MRRKTMLRSAAALIVAALAFTVCFACACSGGDEHEHHIYDVEAVAPTCVSEGNTAYSYCIYCGDIFLNGKEADMSDVTLAKDPDNHAEPVEYPYVAPTCLEEGVKAHVECAACGAYVIDGVTVSEEEIAVPVDETAHVLSEVEGYAATCSSKGLYDHSICEVCGRMFVDGKEVTSAELVIDEDPSAHVLTHSDATKSTCTTRGLAAHDRCDLCGRYFIDGREVEEDAIATDVDPDNHSLIDVEEREASCYESGCVAHEECTECGRWFVDGVETDETSSSIPAGHDFGENGLECSVCGAYKMLYGGQYYVVDETNRYDFTENSLGASHSSSQSNRISNIESLLEDKMTFSTQLGNSGSSAAATADGGWVITGTNKDFTRFCVSQDGKTGYVGRFILVFDVNVSSDVSVTRLGAGVTYTGRDSDGAIDGAVTFYNSAPCGIVGSSSSAGIKTDCTLSSSETYRMMILVETTTPDDVLVQIVTEMASTTLTLSDLHIIFLDESGELEEGGKTNLIYFGTAGDSVYAKEDCTHAWAGYQDGRCYACGNV